MSSHNFELVGGDTDGLAFRKPDHAEFSEEQIKALLTELNSKMPKLIRWENDGVFPAQLVVKAKNYALLYTNGKVKIKGSALKATTKEKALQKFLREVIDHLLVHTDHKLVEEIYYRYAREIVNLKDITEWCSKKTITKAVLTNTRTNEKRVRDSLKGRPVQEGDKIYTFFKSPTEISLREDFDGTFDESILLSKLYDTLCIFKPVIREIKVIPNLALKRNKHILEGLKHGVNNSWK